MAKFEIYVTIENKPEISDPEGATILNDLVLQKSYSFVKQIRVAKMLKFTVNEKTKQSAKQKIKTLCDELRLYNPMVSKMTLKIFDA